MGFAYLAFEIKIHLVNTLFPYQNAKRSSTRAKNSVPASFEILVSLFAHMLYNTYVYLTTNII